MSDMKPIASLSSNLLARKGSARPAMRPQIQPRNLYPMPQFQHAALPDDDLGWNDMGEEAAGREAVAPQPAAEAAWPKLVHGPDPFATRIPAGVGSRIEPLRKLTAKSPERRSALAEGRRAAFTLRIDKERHRKLRLACTAHGRSAQRLVTEALDRLLNDIAEREDASKRVLPGGPGEKRP